MNNIGVNNLGYDYYAINSPSSNAISLSNRFITSYSLSTIPFDPISFVGAICIIIFIIAILLGLLAVFPSPPDGNRSSPIVLVEKILTESYQVPDYATIEKIRQGGFPDYATFKQALDNGITSYIEWLSYQKNQ